VSPGTKQLSLARQESASRAAAAIKHTIRNRISNQRFTLFCGCRKGNPQIRVVTKVLLEHTYCLPRYKTRYQTAVCKCDITIQQKQQKTTTVWIHIST